MEKLGRHAPRECEDVSPVPSRPVLRDARKRVPQDEDGMRGAISNPHGEEAQRAVSNHEAVMREERRNALIRGAIGVARTKSITTRLLFFSSSRPIATGERSCIQPAIVFIPLGELPGPAASSSNTMWPASRVIAWGQVIA
jgi:hypothetical protein